MAWLLAGALGVLVSIALTGWGRHRRGKVQQDLAQVAHAAQLQGERQLRVAELQAKQALLTVQQEHERELLAMREAIQADRARLRGREGALTQRLEGLERRERLLEKREAQLLDDEAVTRRAEEEVEAALKEARRRLEEVACLSHEEARSRLVAAVEQEAQRQVARQIRRITVEARDRAEEQARHVLATAVARYAGAYVAEKTVSVVQLPSDEMKGRIIGREGRNIRAIEAATGVDLIVDDTPGVVVLSAFDPLRREIARLAMQCLVADGRIHPARIEDVVQRTKGEVELCVARAGEKAAIELGIAGLHPELVRRVGQLQYRSVDGQNCWHHVMETAALAGIMAAELDADALLARRAGLLHDIGKAVPHDVPGNHAQIAADLAQRFGESVAVADAIAQHHAEAPGTVLGVLVQAAVTLSRARPGARRDEVDHCVRRLAALEQVAQDFAGVQKAWAMQAGNEVYVMVDHAHLDDEEALALSGAIAARIHDELTYPGEVRVTVVRQTRATEIAR